MMSCNIHKIRGGKLALFTVAMLLCAANPSAFASSLKFVDSFDLSGATCGLGMRPKSNAAVDGKPLTVGGKVYERGIGTRPEGAILFRSDGKVSSFDALVAIDDGAKDAGSGKSEGKHSGFYVANVPAHATKLVKMRPVDCRKCE